MPSALWNRLSTACIAVMLSAIAAHSQTAQSISDEVMRMDALRAIFPGMRISIDIEKKLDASWPEKEEPGRPSFPDALAGEAVYSVIGDATARPNVPHRRTWQKGDSQMRAKSGLSCFIGRTQVQLTCSPSFNTTSQVPTRHFHAPHRDCANTFELAGHEEFRGKQVTVYRFNAPSDGCFGPETVNYQQYAAAKTGRILVDDNDGNVIQMEYKDVGTPPELGGGIERSYSWNYVKIGDASYLLPVATDMAWTIPNGGGWHVATQFRNHRHFDASTDITFK